MTEERKEQCRKIADGLERCCDPKLSCDGCMYEHVAAETVDECGGLIACDAVKAIRELLAEVEYWKATSCHLKEMAGRKCTESRGADAPRNDSEGEGCSKGEAWQLGLYERAISRWGDKAQVLKAIEELGELAVELSRWLNSYDPADEHLLSHIREELADVCIMTDQLQLIFGDVSDWEMHKLERLERLLERGLR